MENLSVRNLAKLAFLILTGKIILLFELKTQCHETDQSSKYPWQILGMMITVECQ